jgi:hypothetical protein
MLAAKKDIFIFFDFLSAAASGENSVSIIDNNNVVINKNTNQLLILPTKVLAILQRYIAYNSLVSDKTNFFN